MATPGTLSQDQFSEITAYRNRPVHEGPIKMGRLGMVHSAKNQPSYERHMLPRMGPDMRSKPGDAARV